MASITLRSTKGSPLTNTEVDNNFSNINTELGTKLTATSYTALDVLNKLKTVDGAGSGLDADLLDGLSSSSANTISTIVARNATGGFSAGAIIGTSFTGALSSINASISGGSIGGVTIDWTTVNRPLATAISTVASGNLISTNVGAALNELQLDIDTRAKLAGVNTFTGAPNYFSSDTQTGYSTGALQVRSIAGDVHLGLHASGATACSIKHTRGVEGVTFLNSVNALAPITASAINVSSVTTTSISGLTTPLSVAQGGTGNTLNSSARIANTGGWNVTPTGTTLQYNYNGTNVGSLDSLGNITVTGAITGGTLNSISLSTIGTNSTGTKTISTAAPTGGVNGDIWYRV